MLKSGSRLFHVEAHMQKEKAGRKVNYPGAGHLKDRAKCPVNYPIYVTFSPIHYWIGTGNVIKCDLYTIAGHIGNFTFRPVIYIH